ncbi:hypothetical protein LTR37_005243 [Vermiconidia calcicola]|uniref:Uncharacterized protein n=1 Tax=Vermiconidia calcicola TaxID=1690605 RepID=A0ACC3NMC0_9PEZI|nr:hypothetical protein LTR37_005243 [Vermiconidia calcicola]
MSKRKAQEVARSSSQPSPDEIEWEGFPDDEAVERPSKAKRSARANEEPEPIERSSTTTRAAVRPNEEPEPVERRSESPDVAEDIRVDLEPMPLHEESSGNDDDEDDFHGFDADDADTERAESEQADEEDDGDVVPADEDDQATAVPDEESEADSEHDRWSKAMFSQNGSGYSPTAPYPSVMSSQERDEIVARESIKNYWGIPEQVIRAELIPKVNERFTTRPSLMKFELWNQQIVTQLGDLSRLTNVADANVRLQKVVDEGSGRNGMRWRRSRSSMSQHG